MKILFINILFLTALFAEYQKVKIGKIDSYYQDKITVSQLKLILKEIEHTFESQLGQNVFDYSSSGKPIDLLYLAPSKVETRIKRKIASFEKNQEKINKLKNYFPEKKKEIKRAQEKYNIHSNILNTKIKNLNKYVKEVNKKNRYPKKEYDEIKNYIKTKKADIKKESREKRKLESQLRKVVSQFNNKIHSYNNLARKSSMLANDIESLQRSHKIVRGKTFGQKETILKTYIKDGRKYKERTTQNTMDKIEIYSFENLKQLKVVLAHEIGHLVGLPHINYNNALMNPILQKSQERRLTLTYEDISNFNKHFNFTSR